VTEERLAQVHAFFTPHTSVGRIPYHRSTDRTSRQPSYIRGAGTSRLQPRQRRSGLSLGVLKGGAFAVKKMLFVRQHNLPPALPTRSRRSCKLERDERVESNDGVFRDGAGQVEVPLPDDRGRHHVIGQ
jgi:hypothetical protein